MTLPLALAGDDVIGQARTGTGKTFGFGIPLLQKIKPAVGTAPQALVVVPTRELCIQVTKDLALAGKYLGARISAIYGGRPYPPQIAELTAGVDIVVGTPGRLLDLQKQGHLDLGEVQMLVLDEADEMLDLGFLPAIEKILTIVPTTRQTLLFSATMATGVLGLARTFLNQPIHVRAEQGEENTTAIHARTQQLVYRAHAMDKVDLVAKVLQAKDRGLSMIFSRTKRTAQQVADDLKERGFNVTAIHGDLGQIQREKALKSFRSGTADVMVATDVAARGIDIDDVTHVINYQCPDDESTYVHRIGRTGRAGRTGIAVTLVDWDEERRWESIDKTLGLNIGAPVETYSTSAHLFTDLNIPENVTGRLVEPAKEEKPAPAERAPRTANRERRRTRGEAKTVTKPIAAKVPVAKAPVAKAEPAAEQASKPARRRRRTRSSAANATPTAD
jgi:superfamily II DNA/RNA helicase